MQGSVNQNLFGISYRLSVSDSGIAMQDCISVRISYCATENWAT